MVIGLDARFFGPRGKGLGRYTQKLIENLELIDNKNEYCVFLRQENFNDYQPKNPHFKKVLADYHWYSLAEQIFSPIKIWQAKVDLMHFPHFNVPIFCPTKFVVTIHDLILRHFKTRRASTLGPVRYFFKNLAYQLVIWLALKRSKKVITVSNYVKKDILDCFKISPTKVEVIYEGTPSPLLPTTKERDKKQIAWLWQNYKIKLPYLLYVGNAYPHKNLESLIEAFKILVTDFDRKLQLVLVGEKDYFYQRLEKLVCSRYSGILKNIIFTGFVPDKSLNIFYRYAEVYVFPSLCEGFGLPALEAMSHGLLVVSSNSTCLPEILGPAALYFDPENTQEIAEKIKKALEDEKLKEALIAKGFTQIKKYSWAKMAEETLSCYN